MRSAGIKVWMLTGDKVETATCIAMSAGFKSKKQSFFYIKEQREIKQVDYLLKEFSRRTDNVLMIDGDSLDVILSNKALEDSFFSVATLAPSVCVCRCSPT